MTTPLYDNRRISFEERKSEGGKEGAPHYKNVPGLLGGCRDGLGGFDRVLRLGSGDSRDGLFPGLMKESPVELKM